MNDHWRTPDGRWNIATQDRISRRFRHHIRNNNNPKGRIIRMECQFYEQHPDDRFKLAEAHHIDYADEYRIVWACYSCHRKIEAGSIRIQKKHIWDYTSLIKHIGRPGGKVENRVKVDIEEVPF